MVVNLKKNLASVCQSIAQHCYSCGRSPEEVKLVAVSKQKSVELIQQAYDAGHRVFGENYLQDALPKIKALASLKIEWHFIGRVQSNKAKEIATHFDWVQTVDNFRHAEKLSQHRPAHLPSLNICLQVNISGETQKGGVLPEAVPNLLSQISGLPRLCVRGLMAVGSRTEDEAQQAAEFSHVSDLMKQFPTLDTLSIGMSQDMKTAIAAGATLVRIGSAVFGRRES